jgi:hypothetical protein
MCCLRGKQNLLGELLIIAREWKVSRPFANWEDGMTEQSGLPRPRNTMPGKSNPYVVLGFCMLLIADIVIVTLIFKQGLFPGPSLSATLLETGMPSYLTTASETPLNGVSSVETKLPITPLVETPPGETPTTETPILFQTPALTTPSPGSLPQAYGTCQYALKSGKKDYLFTIYLNWQIIKNIPNVKDYYAAISCAVLLSNTSCDYHAAYPDITQPGWILILPGVSPDICLSHGGTPAR